MEFFRGPLPLEKICRFLLNEKFAKFLKQKVTKDQLTLDLPSGKLTVSDIDLNPSIFNTGYKSVLLRAVKIGNVEVQMAGKVPTSVCLLSWCLLCNLLMMQAAKSFFSDTVHDNLTVKVSDIRVELDILKDIDTAATPPESDEEVPPCHNFISLAFLHLTYSTTRVLLLPCLLQLEYHPLHQLVWETVGMN
jgi:hypothetical protein